ncbi:MAG: MarR family transcriptional regulator [Pseudomonadota bacterium]
MSARQGHRGRTAATDHAAPNHADATGEAPHTPLWSRPGYLIRRLHQSHTAIFADECRAYGITPVQSGILTALLHRPNIDQATLGAEVGIDRTNAADVLERLAERGLVRRAKSAQDRRMMLASLTPAGRALTREMHTAMMRAQVRLLDALSTAERKSFMRLLAKLVDAIGINGDAAKARPKRN